jgi:hypothetical protein
VKTETQATRIALEGETQEAKEAALEGEAAAGKEEKAEKVEKAEKGKGACKSCGEHPLIAANAASIAGLSLLVLFGAYKKYQAGQLTWKAVGLWSAGVAVFGVADFFASRYITLPSTVKIGVNGAWGSSLLLIFWPLWEDSYLLKRYPPKTGKP